MELSSVLLLIGAFVIMPTLIAGAISDLKTRTFPKEYWNYTRTGAGIFVGLAYCLMVANGQWQDVVILLIISGLASLFFLFMGLRFGSGGDWRAMIYIAWISPWLLITSCVFIGVIAVVQSILTMSKKEGGAPRYFREIPFAIAIAVGFYVAVIYSVIMGVFF